MILNTSLFDNDSNRGSLIGVIMCTILIVAVGVTIAGYYYSFIKKSKYAMEAHIVNNRIISILSIIWVCSVIFAILTWLYSVGLLTNEPSNGGFIGLLISSFACILGICIYIILFLQYIAIGITDMDLSFLGEKILIDKIVNFKENNDLKYYELEYIEGRRNNKKMNFKFDSLCGKFLWDNRELFINKINQDLVADSNTFKKTSSEIIDEIKETSTKKTNKLSLKNETDKTKPPVKKVKKTVGKVTDL